MQAIDHDDILRRLIDLQSELRKVVMRSMTAPGAHDALRTTAADTIYSIDADVEPLLEDFCRAWAKTTPLILIAEGIESEGEVEGVKIFPEGAKEHDARIKLIVDPIDGTRGIMYD